MKYVCGGIGDLIQSFDSIRAGDQIRVFTHFKKAQDFFSFTKADFDYRFFDSVQELQEINKEIEASGEELERQIFQDFLSVPNERYELARRNANGLKDIIGIHPVGSKLSNDFWDRLGRPLKILPEWFVRGMIKDDNGYFIFGTPDELASYKELIGSRPNVKYIDYENIWDSLCHVSLCSTVIGVDSAIKSMSAAQKIQTIVFVGDYEDEFRDKNFITPYVDEGVMRAVRFSAINRAHLKLFNDHENNF